MIPVAAFFLMARQVVRGAQMEKIRNATLARAAATAVPDEQGARISGLQRMRANSRAQMNVELASRGLAMPGMDGSPSAAHIQAAAAKSNSVGM